ncbi:MAG: hypothetical protein COT17_07995 [Elusimicrobia bacterium CG08_land_8_20_14_0_20_51_18]|nr:MAG: hypothetical protein COT17_07995 [Elusimicrobia bacterium CG08_land_8_20_14_0_20_51_18]
MHRGLLYAVVALCLALHACKQKEDVVVFSPRTEGTASAKAVAVIPREPRAHPTLDIKHIKDLELSAPMAEVLAVYDPDFLRWSLSDYPPEKLKYYPYSSKSLPYVVLGDYNGDGIEDVVLTGHNKNANIIVALMSTATGYYAIEVQKASYYSKSREKGKEIPYTSDGILLFQRKGSRYVIGDMDTSEVILENDGFAVQHIRWFNNDTSEFGPIRKIRISDVYGWDPLTSKFYGNFLEEEAATTIVKYALRTDFEKMVFEEKTGSNSRGGASVKIAVKSGSGEWLVQKPLRTNDGVIYYGIFAGTEIKTIYSCIAPNPYSEKSWKVSESYQISPLHGGYSDSNPPPDLKRAAGDMPNPLISRVLPVGISFGYHWIAPDFAVEIKKEAIFNYACQDSKLTTIFAVKAP